MPTLGTRSGYQKNAGMAAQNGLRRNPKSCLQGIVLAQQPVLLAAGFAITA